MLLKFADAHTSSCKTIFLKANIPGLYKKRSLFIELECDNSCFLSHGNKMIQLSFSLTTNSVMWRKQNNPNETLCAELQEQLNYNVLLHYRSLRTSSPLESTEHLEAQTICTDRLLSFKQTEAAEIWCLTQHPDWLIHNVNVINSWGRNDVHHHWMAVYAFSLKDGQFGPEGCSLPRVSNPRDSSIT